MAANWAQIILLMDYASASSVDANSTACTDPTPIVASITEVTLSNGNTLRGIAASIGTPAKYAPFQKFALVPHVWYNDTWVYNPTSQCPEDTTQMQCLTMDGGIYNSSQSSSSKTPLSDDESGGDIHDELSLQNMAWATDIFYTGDTSIKEFPLAMPGESYLSQNTIGMGQNSTLLNALKDSGKIASRSWSYWWGIDSANSSASMDGHFVLGGYDAAKVTGPNITLKLDPSSCGSGMSFDVNALVLNFLNGTKANVLEGIPFVACVQPDFATILTVQSTVFRQMINIAGTKMLNKNSTTETLRGFPLLDPKTVFAGSLTISVNGGLSFEIPNNVLVAPDQHVSSAGTMTSNLSASIMLLSALTTATGQDMSGIVGKDFFSSTYLMVDLDAQTYTLWEANATTESRLVAVGGNCPGSTAAAPPTTIPSSAAPILQHKSPAVKIAGITVGTILGASALAAGVLFLLFRPRRRAQKRDAPTTDAEVAESQDIEPSAQFDATSKQGEIHGESTSPAEVDASTWHRHELLVESQTHELESPTP